MHMSHLSSALDCGRGPGRKARLEPGGGEDLGAEVIGETPDQARVGEDLGFDF